MLRVDGPEARARRLRQLGHQRAAHHERLLVGEGDINALTECRERGAKPGCAHNGVEHEIAPEPMASSSTPSGPLSTVPLNAERAWSAPSGSAMAMRSTPSCSPAPQPSSSLGLLRGRRTASGRGSDPAHRRPGFRSSPSTRARRRARRRSSQPEPGVVAGDRREEHGIEAVERPAMRAEQRARVFDLRLALEERLKEIADRETSATMMPRIRASVPVIQSWYSPQIQTAATAATIPISRPSTVLLARCWATAWCGPPRGRPGRQRCRPPGAGEHVGEHAAAMEQIAQQDGMRHAQPNPDDAKIVRAVPTAVVRTCANESRKTIRKVITTTSARCSRPPRWAARQSATMPM